MFNQNHQQILTAVRWSEMRLLVCFIFLPMAMAGCARQSSPGPQPYTSKYTSLEDKQKACERGELAECAEVGSAYLKGEGVAKDKERGLNYLNKGCDGKIPKACFGLGVGLLFQGTGTAQDVIKGVASIRQACDDKYGEACFFLGTMSEGLIQLPGLEPNKELAKSYYKKGCEYGHKESCSGAK